MCNNVSDYHCDIPFLRPELADRLAAMLNYNLKQLCGNKSAYLLLLGLFTSQDM